MFLSEQLAFYIYATPTVIYKHYSPIIRQFSRLT
jgi:hypothetical protein